MPATHIGQDRVFSPKCVAETPWWMQHGRVLASVHPMHSPLHSPTPPQKYERENIADALVSQAFAKGQQVVKQVGLSSLLLSHFTRSCTVAHRRTSPPCTMGRMPDAALTCPQCTAVWAHILLQSTCCHHLASSNSHFCQLGEGSITEHC